MTIDFNGAGAQGGGGGGAIPPGSVVRLKLSIRRPSDEKMSDVDPILTEPKNGSNDYINCEFEVTDGQFKGRKIWQNYVLAGSEKATNISMAAFRAMIESNRGISPDDDSAATANQRCVASWADFDGIEFAAEVKCQQPKANDKYVNNEIFKIITCVDEHYEMVMGGGDFISERPVPAIPDGGGSQGGGGGGQSGGSWSGGGQQQSAGTTQQGTAGGQPGWANKG